MNLRACTRLGLAAVLSPFVVLIAVSGCQQATPVAPVPPEQEPEVVPTPTLLGTWTATYDDEPDEDSEEQHVRFVDTITFTADRFIQHRAHYRADGTLDSWWADSGTWEDTEDGFVTRVWLRNHDDDDDTPDVETRVKKRYLWLDSSHNTLLMHHWSDSEQRSDNNFDLTPTPGCKIHCRRRQSWEPGLGDEMRARSPRPNPSRSAQTGHSPGMPNTRNSQLPSPGSGR